MSALTWRGVSKANPCVICGKPDWCRGTACGTIADCNREGGPGGFEKRTKTGQVYYRHFSKTPPSPSFDRKAAAAIEPDDLPGIRYDRQRANDDELHKIHTDLLDRLPLYDWHRKELMSRRGLTSEEVEELGYRSFPKREDAQRVVAELEAKYGLKLLSVPGFDSVERDVPLTDGTVTRSSDLRLSGSDGSLLPQRDSKGRIVGIVLRLDDRPATGADTQAKNTRLRYLPLTSRTRSGCAAKIGVHHSIHVAKKLDATVRVIEGIIKADIATLRTGILTLGIPSGGQWTVGLEEAVKTRPNDILIAPDADTASNQGICSTLVHALHPLAAKEMKFTIKTWPKVAGKGLDDVLTAGHADQVKTLCGVSAWRLLASWLASMGVAPPPFVVARIVLDGIVERVTADPTHAFSDIAAEAFAAMEAGTRETQRLKAALEKALDGSAWADFQEKVKTIRAKTEKKAKAEKLKEVVAGGGHVFLHGDQAEAAKKLLDDLTPVGGRGSNHDRCVHDRAALYLYDQGIYTKLDQAGLVTRIANYSGSPVAQAGKLKVSAGFAKGTVELVCANRDQPGFFDKSPKGVAFKNGFLAIEPKKGTAGLVVHEPAHRVRVRYDFDYEPGGTPARFLAALDRYFRKDNDKAEKMACIQEHMGACIVGEATRLQKAVIFQGQGNDGKSTLAKIISKAMPFGSVVSVPPQRFDDQYYRAALDGALLNCVFEMPEGELVESAPVKAIVVGDAIDARFPYGKPFQMEPRAGHVWVCNRLFKLRDADPAFRRRFMLITFNEPLGEGEVNDNFVSEIVANELPQIVSWAIEGLKRRLGARDYTTPASSTMALNTWMEDSDTLGAFLAECCAVLDPKDPSLEDQWVKAKPLYDEYRSWAQANGHAKLLHSGNFAAKIRDRFKLTKANVKRTNGSFYPLTIKDADAVQADRVMASDGEKYTVEDLDKAAAVAVEREVPRLRLVVNGPPPAPPPPLRDETTTERLVREMIESLAT